MSVAGAALPVIGYIPVALIFSEGAGSVLAVVWLTGAHLYTQALGNAYTKRSRAGPSHINCPDQSGGVRVQTRGITFPRPDRSAILLQNFTRKEQRHERSSLLVPEIGV